MKNKLRIAGWALLIISVIMILVGIIWEVNDFLTDHYCYQLDPYELNNTPKCSKYVNR